jgi:hypothetical protein
MAGSIVKGDIVWFKATRAWLKLADDVLPRLSLGSRAERILRKQRDSTVYLLDVTDETSETVADLRRAIIASREHFRTAPTEGWDMPFPVETFIESIDELISMLGE